VCDPVSTPTVPPDYYRALYEAEERHWWHRGMRAITVALLGSRLQRPGLRLLDAGCGTGGMLAWAIERAQPAEAAGVDVSEEALALAAKRAPGADLRRASVTGLPFADESFDLVLMNDVLQHVREDEVQSALGELRRVLAPSGSLLVRTNGGLRARRASAEWRVYDRVSVATTFKTAGLRCLRLTYANVVGSSWATLSGHSPQEPGEGMHGVPEPTEGRADALMERLLHLEARYLARPGRSLPYGHTLFALAERA
jgi:SAM-dependent methyltransferase